MRRKNLHDRVARLTVCASNDLLANVRFVEHDEVSEFDSRAGTWDELPAEDRALNLRSLEKGEEGRIFSAFTLLDEPIYVITERDRSCTTVLLASDY